MNAVQMNNALAVVGANDRYQAGSIAWNDGQRGVSVSSQGVATLSPWGSNITDCCIATEDGGICQYIKPPNMNETIGVTDAEHILVKDDTGATVSLQHVLDTLGKDRYGYRGYTAVEAGHRATEKVVVRFQTAWVPIQSGTDQTHIVPQHYSYQTRDQMNPRNFLLLGTPRGMFVHSDTLGANKLFAHSVTATGTVRNHWFTAEANKECQVGHAAVGSADAGEMGIRGMGPRTNCFVTVALPNVQSKDSPQGAEWAQYDDDGPYRYRSLAAVGESYAARVSVAEHSVGDAAATPIAIKRPVGEPIVVTVLTYNTIQGPRGYVGEPTALAVDVKDVAHGVADLDHQYSLVVKNGGTVCKLSELPAMLSKLTLGDMEDILTTALKHAPISPAPPPPSPSYGPMTPTPSAMNAVAGLGMVECPGE